MAKVVVKDSILRFTYLILTWLFLYLETISKMLPCQYKNSHYKDKIFSWLCYLYTGICQNRQCPYWANIPPLKVFTIMDKLYELWVLFQKFDFVYPYIFPLSFLDASHWYPNCVDISNASSISICSLPPKSWSMIMPSRALLCFFQLPYNHCTGLWFHCTGVWFPVMVKPSIRIRMIHHMDPVYTVDVTSVKQFKAKWKLCTYTICVQHNR